VGKITKKKFEKYFKDVCKKKRKKKKLGREIDELVKSIAMEQLDAHGDEGMEKIVIDNVSIEISSENPEVMAASATPEGMASAGAASTNCFYVCYVIGGRRICRKVCW
jgi:hypothetical protein